MGAPPSDDVEVHVNVVLNVDGIDIVERHRVAVAQVDARVAVDIAGDVGQQVLRFENGQAVDVLGDLEHVLAGLEIYYQVVAAAAGEDEGVVAGATGQYVVAA